MVINDPAVLAEATCAFEAYEHALVDNDAAMLRTLFWDDALTLRYGTAENLYGAEAIAAFRAARPAGPRPRDLLRVTITTFGHDLATANAEYRVAARATVGRQSQTWVRLEVGWRIVAAHVSHIED